MKKIRRLYRGLSGLERAIVGLVVVILAMFVLFTCQATAQGGVYVGSGYAKFGNVTESITHHVRAGGNHRQALGFSVRIESELTDRLMGYGSFIYSDTYLYSFPCETDCEAPQPLNPGAGRSADLRIHNTAFGVTFRPWRLIAIGGGAGVASVDGRYFDFGSLPMHSLSLHALANLCLPMGERGAVCAEAQSFNITPREGRFTAFADRAGRDISVDHRGEDEWWNNYLFSITFGWTP